jgi:hypothetical protein
MRRLATLADPKPARRIVDGHAYREFHALAKRCLFCGERFGEAHHILSRGRGGDDLLANFVPLCFQDHQAVHGTPYTARPFDSPSIRVTGEMVRRRIGAWLVSEEGATARAYLIGKLGPRPAEAFLKNEYGVRNA